MLIDADKVSALLQLSLDGSFTLAAKNLAMTQPALSKKISRLEDELEISLVVRGQKKVTLTDAGIELIRYHKLKRDLDLELVEKLSLKEGQSSVGGSIDIAAYSSVARSVVLPQLAHLSQQFSRLRLNMIVREVYELEQTLTSGEVSFVVSPHPIVSNGVIHKKIGLEKNVLIYPNQEHFPDVYLDHDTSDQTTINFFRQHGKSFHGRRSFFSDVYAIIDAVSYGFGKAVVSEHLVQDRKDILVDSNFSPMVSEIYLSYYERSYYPKVQEAVIESFY